MLGQQPAPSGPQLQNCILTRRIFNFVIIWLRGVGDNFIHSTNIFTAYHVQSFPNKIAAHSGKSDTYNFLLISRDPVG